MGWRRVVLLVLIGMVAGGAVAYLHWRARRARGPHMAAIMLVVSPEVDREVVRAVTDGLAGAYGVACAESPTALALPASGYDAARRQYVASTVREVLRRLVPHPETYVLGLTHADLYQPGLNFVFGESDLAGNVAVMSVARMYPRHRPPEMARLRVEAAKIAIHELGHARGLPHCVRPECVMHFANSLGELDLTSDRFCHYCEARLR